MSKFVISLVQGINCSLFLSNIGDVFLSSVYIYELFFSQYFWCLICYSFYCSVEIHYCLQFMAYIFIAFTTHHSVFCDSSKKTQFYVLNSYPLFFNSRHDIRMKTFERMSPYLEVSMCYFLYFPTVFHVIFALYFI